MPSEQSPSLPRITIITSTLNCAGALAATAQSIRSQTYSNVQWIVADGGSTDGTVERIRESTVSHWFSEADSGIYDAWNKACQFIDGEWVLFLGAGDLLMEVDTLQKVGTRLAASEPEILVVYGNVIQGEPGTAGRRYGEVNLKGWDLFRPALPAHQGVFARSGLFSGPSPFDSSYRVAADSKFLLQIIRGEVTRYVDVDITRWVPGGISEHPKSTLRVMRELLRLESDLGYRIPPVRRFAFVLRSYGRAIVYRLAGANAVELAARAKRGIGRIFL